ncbi:hypothetical protein EB796_019528 [Bugula neritina]|uniref:Uncharacterized protein n=1 Tax=Bugula neritina TaxID=10212 RepID=A0A7J7J9C0_BUGNE|nr:hypothetical protein EB796_019528 [Bugula neritina]
MVFFRVMNGHCTPSSQKLLINKDLSLQILTQLNECRLRQQFTDVILTVDQEELHCHSRELLCSDGIDCLQGSFVYLKNCFS